MRDEAGKVTADRYDPMLSLADLFDAAGAEVHRRSGLGAEILCDADVVDTAELSPRTWAEAEDDLRAATTGQDGLLTRAAELDADALVVRATVLTYRWIDDLQQAAYQTLGSIAGRAIGYLAPEVALGGAIVSAGLIETDTLDRDGVAAYLDELAADNPELMEHVAGGGSLLDGLQMRAALTAAVLGSEQAPQVSRAGLHALGVEPFPADAVSALRDAAGGLVEALERHPGEPDSGSTAAPRSVEELMSRLAASESRISVQHVGEDRYICYLAGRRDRPRGRLRLAGADASTHCRDVVRAIDGAVRDDEVPARVLIVGAAHGGCVAVEVAAAGGSDRFVIDQVVTAGAPTAQVPVVHTPTRVLSLEDRADPVALLGSLVNAGVAHRVTVVVDGSGADDGYVSVGRAVDEARHPQLRAEVERLRGLGFLAG